MANHRMPDFLGPLAMSPALMPRAPPIPLHRLALLDQPSLVKRAPASTTSSSTRPQGSKCGPNDTTGICERPTTTSSRTIPIVVATVIPISIAIIVLFLLHRRHVKKLRNEDLNDKHKSLDFGLDFASSGEKKNKRRKGVEMSGADTEKRVRGRGHGLSMDMDLANPYLLPPTLHGSRESLHSLSRSMTGNDDKYRPATAFSPTGDNVSMRSFPTSNHYRPGLMDDSSSHTASTNRFAHGEEPNHNLLRNAQPISKSPPPPPFPPQAALRAQSTSPPCAPEPQIPQFSNVHDDRVVAAPPPAARYEDKALPPQRPAWASSKAESSPPAQTRISSPVPDLPSPSPSSPVASPPSNNRSVDLEFNIRSSPPRQTQSPPPLQTEYSRELPPQNLLPPRISLTFDDDGSDYGDDLKPPTDAPVPQVNIHLAESENKPPLSNHRVSVVPDDFYDQYLEPDMRRLTMGVRPLPPEDPSDSPEQRANRIRSFYKEYFDDSKPFTEDYYEDYGPEFHDLPAPPFAQGIGRRAMTPPPRMPPRFGGGPGAGNFGGGPAMGPGHRPIGSFAGGPGPRAFSSASGRMPGGMPRKPAPPPAPLHDLPTPHKLKDDTMILPIDYAPVSRAKERREGRPGTPMGGGGLRPYSPAVPVHIPLASSYDDLAVIPSPHALRRSGTFTALDFAPPPRFRNADTASDAGSIRSNRTGVSAAHVYGVRTGAYRLSRLPQDTVGTRQDITSSLRPKWDLGR